MLNFAKRVPSPNYLLSYRFFTSTVRNRKMDEVLDFWFSMSFADQFKKDPALDAAIAQKFGEQVKAAVRGEYDELATTSGRNALGTIILLDQFTRNIFRDTPAAFSGDEKALQLSKNTIAAGLDSDLNQGEKMFLYMPFMHSENLADQDRCIELNAAAGNPTNFGEQHKAVIVKYGRFPHRNKILGRENTPEEVEYLKDPNAGF